MSFCQIDTFIVGSIVAAFHHHRRAQLEHARVAGADPDQVVDELRRQPGFHAKNQSLGAGHVVDGDEEIGDVFHAAAVAEFAEVAHRAGEIGE